MKRMGPILLALALVFQLAACGAAEGKDATGALPLEESMVLVEEETVSSFPETAPVADAVPRPDTLSLYDAETGITLSLGMAQDEVYALLGEPYSAEEFIDQYYPQDEDEEDSECRLIVEYYEGLVYVLYVLPLGEEDRFYFANFHFGMGPDEVQYATDNRETSSQGFTMLVAYNAAGEPLSITEDMEEEEYETIHHMLYCEYNSISESWSYAFLMERNTQAFWQGMT